MNRAAVRRARLTDASSGCEAARLGRAGETRAPGIEVLIFFPWQRLTLLISTTRPLGCGWRCEDTLVLMSPALCLFALGSCAFEFFRGDPLWPMNSAAEGRILGERGPQGRSLGFRTYVADGCVMQREVVAEVMLVRDPPIPFPRCRARTAAKGPAASSVLQHFIGSRRQNHSNHGTTLRATNTNISIDFGPSIK